MEEEDKRGIGAARNADKFVEPSLARGPQGAKGAKGHHTKGGAASSAKVNKMRLNADGSREINHYLCDFGQINKEIQGSHKLKFHSILFLIKYGLYILNLVWS